MHGKPLFPFGHGLSYATFKYSGLKLSANKVKADGNLNVSVEVKNTGKRAGDEVIQLYVHSSEEQREASREGTAWLRTRQLKTG